MNEPEDEISIVELRVSKPKLKRLIIIFGVFILFVCLCYIVTHTIVQNHQTKTIQQDEALQRSAWTEGFNKGTDSGALAASIGLTLPDANTMDDIVTTLIGQQMDKGKSSEELDAYEEGFTNGYFDGYYDVKYRNRPYYQPNQ